MRKHLVFLLLLFIGAIASVCYFSYTIKKEQNSITFEEEVIYGDRSLANGLVVNLEIDYQNQLFWDITCKIAENPEVSSEFRFYPTFQKQKVADSDYRFKDSYDLNLDGYTPWYVNSVKTADNGEYVACVNLQEFYSSNIGSNGFIVYIFNEAELKYAGIYRSSLDTATEKSAFNTSYDFQVSWQ